MAETPAQPSPILSLPASLPTSSRMLSEIESLFEAISNQSFAGAAASKGQSIDGDLIVRSYMFSFRLKPTRLEVVQ
jgi:hypothetical protein